MSYKVLTDQSAEITKLNQKEFLIDKIQNKLSEDDFYKYFFELKPNEILYFNEITKEQKEIYFSKDGYYYFFDFDMIDDIDRRFNDLSSGEQILFGQLLNIYFFLDSSSRNEFIFLLDEPEISLHPNWQKNYINEIYNLVKKLDKQCQFIISSHSPFILSDIPKENVIFLEKDEKTGNCINATDKMKDFKTFGANIHTLLSNGFFMKYGLMGEFAKNKIRIIQITYKYILHRYKQKSLNKKEHKKSRRFIRTQLKTLWYIQSIIGEPFLQTIMKNYIQEIEQILYGNEKTIDKEIERLEDLKKSIKNAKS